MFFEERENEVLREAGAERLAKEARGPVEKLIWNDGIHCCHDRSHMVRPAMADYLARQL